MITSPPLYEIKDNQLIISKLKELKFGRDFYPQFKGYCVEKEGELWISTIEAKHIGAGHFSRFINNMKLKYKKIIIPTPSKMMIKIGIHLGFELKKYFFKEPFNEWGDILEWCGKDRVYEK